VRRDAPRGAMANLSTMAGVRWLVLAPTSIALCAPGRTAMLICLSISSLDLHYSSVLPALEGSNALVLQILGVKPQTEEQRRSVVCCQRGSAREYRSPLNDR
jgi:hypothetical protein